MLEIVADNRTPVVAQISNLMKRLVGIPVPPVVRGVGPTPLPRPERLYFWFGEPIDTKRFARRRDDPDAARAVRDETKQAIEAGIEFLLAERDADPNRGLVSRLVLRERRGHRRSSWRPDAPVTPTLTGSRRVTAARPSKGCQVAHRQEGSREVLAGIGGSELGLVCR